MEPINININVTLDVSEKTTSLLQGLLGRTAQAPLPEAPKPATRRPRTVETKPDMAAETKEPEKAPETPVEEAEPETAPEPVAQEISDEELREVVYRARKATPTAAMQIKNVIFPEFGIKTSIECPQERRAELVRRLNELAA